MFLIVAFKRSAEFPVRSFWASFQPAEHQSIAIRFTSLSLRVHTETKTKFTFNNSIKQQEELTERPRPLLVRELTLDLWHWAYLEHEFLD